MRTQLSPSRLASLGAIVVLVLAACSPGPTAVPSGAAPSIVVQSTTPSAGSSAAPGAGGDAMAALVAAAQGEGTLNVIALPRAWCNYGALIDGFKAQYGLAVNSINPNGLSAEELQAIAANTTGPGPNGPDVIDVAVAFAAQAKTQNLIQPYKVSGWGSIDPNDKDPDGYWYGDYYQVLSFEVNTKAVTNIPADWPDLLKSEYKNKVALAGDPLSSEQAIQSVYGAAFSNGGSLDNAQPGLEFFKKLNDAGNLVHTIATSASVASGQTPIVITWSYLAFANSDAEAAKGGAPIHVVIPASGRIGGLYAQAISAFAPHPNAAKLWEEYLYSDAGQNLWLAGRCYTTRYADLKARNAVDPAILAKLPDATGTIFPTAAEVASAKTVITGQWKSVVGATIK